jgi:hypothetical protein
MSTDLQKLAQKENYALFQLNAMKSNLHHVHLQNTNILEESACYLIQKHISEMIALIKRKQTVRKKNRSNKV